MNWSKPQDQKYYIDFSSVRGSNIIFEMKRTILYSKDQTGRERRTCQLFTGHIGCGKSTELSRLKAELEENGFHVVYFESSQELEMGDVDISDILLVISRQIVKSLETVNIRLKPTRFQELLQEVVDILNSEVSGFNLKIPKIGEIGIKSQSGKYSLAFGIGEITTNAKDSKKIRQLLRQHLEPRLKTILTAINEEIIKPAQQKLKQQEKAGLVVIVDNLDRIDNKLKSPERSQPEYLFVDRGEQLKALNCHVVYTIPPILAFSNEQENLRNRFGSEPQILPMVRVKEYDGGQCQEGINLLRQMILARAFTELEMKERFNHINKLFDSPETLNVLCQISGGHVRNLLVLFTSCLKKQDPPFSSELIHRVITQRRSDLSRAITLDEWDLLKQVKRQKIVNGEEKYQVLLRSLFAYEYRDNQQCWCDINPVLEGSKEFADG